MSSIDERVVQAKFDNSQFQEGVRSTISSLDSLKRGMNLSGATQSLDGVAQATGRVSQGFSVMRVAALTAISTITKQLLYTAEHVVAAFTIDPIKAGFENYETQINAVQTIMANTGLKGAEGLQEVNKVLAQLNTYANQTVYNFSEMAKNIGTFTAAGVKLQPASDAIKGIANLAALSGASSQQASMAMYQLSQAIAANQVHLQDWNSVVNAGMGGKVFQSALYNTGVALHTITNAKVGESFDEWTKAGNTFRGTLDSGWVTGKVLTQTLQNFTGDMTKAKLATEGYSQSQIKAILQMGKTATNAATQIKTFSQLGSALKEEVATAYGSVFKTLFGDINQAKSMLSPLHTVLENFLTGPIYAFNNVLQDWSKAGGRTAMIDAFKAAWKDLGEVLAPIRDAFRQIFPATTGSELAKLTKAVRDFFENFKMGAQTTEELKSTFAGLFAVLDIVWQAVKAVAGFLFQMVGVVGHASGGILQFTGNVGDLLVALDDAIKNGNVFSNFFEKLAGFLSPVITLLQMTRIRMLDLFNGIATGVNQASSIIPKVLGVLKAIGTNVVDFFSNLFKGIDWNTLMGFMGVGMAGGIALMIKRLADKLKGGSSGGGITEMFSGIVDAIKEPFEALTATLKQMQQTLQAATILEIATAVGILAVSVIELSHVDPKDLGKALAALGGMFAELLGSTLVFSKIGGAKGLFTTAAGLVVFATAIRVLTSSVVKLSNVSWEGLAKGLSATAVLLGALVGVSRAMSKDAGGMIRSSAGLVLMAAAIRVLVNSVQALSKMSWGEIAKGLTGVGALLVGLTLFTKFAEAGKAGVLQGAGLVLLATGIKILASAAGDFGKMPWGNIIKGLVSIGAILAEFAIFSKTVGNPVTLLASSAALVGIGVAMNILAQAIKQMGNFSWSTIGKGLLTMAGALAIIAIALEAMPITSVLSAAALDLVALALVAIGGALKIMGGMSWTEIAKSLVELGGALAIIAIAMDAMLTALPGAAALVVVTAALALLVPELAALGQLSWTEIAKALVALAGAFVVLGAAAALLSPLIPSLLGLGAAIALLGVGVAAIGGGLFLMGAGLTAIAAAGSAAGAAIVSVGKGIISLLPALAQALATAVGTFAAQISKEGPKLVRAMITMMNSLLQAVRQETPKIATTFLDMIVKILNKVDEDMPKIVNKFSHMLVELLNGIRRNSGPVIDAFTRMVVAILNELANNTQKFVNAAIGWIVAIIHGIDQNLQKIITAGTNLVIHFIQGIEKADIRIINAGMKAIIDFINGVADAIRQHTPELYDAGKNLAGAIADGMTFGLASKVGDVAKAAGNLASGALGGAKKILGVFSPSKEFEKIGKYVGDGFVKGLDGSKANVENAFANLRNLIKAAMQSATQDITNYEQKLKDAQKAGDTKKITEFTNKLAEANKEYNAASDALDTLNKVRDQEQQHLENLGKRYDDLTQKLQTHIQKLQNAKQAEQQYNDQIKQQYDVLPDVQPDTNLQQYTQAGEQSIADLQTFIDTLHKLREQGLSDEMYREFLSKGTVALPLVEEILAGGHHSIRQVNQMGSQLHEEAKSLANTASKQLYQAGVDSAQGLVDGLRKKRKDISKEMRNIADDLVNQIKKDLKIHSPSQIFDELGQFTGQGLANGLTKSVPAVQKATSHLGKNTVESMKTAIRAMKDAIEAQTDMQPTIRPVLDLSDVKKKAKDVHTLLNGQPIALGLAHAAALAHAESQRPAEIAPPPPAPVEVTFNQTNQSPRALTSAEIYRLTNNQLSRAKGALTGVTPTR